MFKKLIAKWKYRRFCRMNRCPDCIYHDFVFEGCVFRGNRCRHPAARYDSDLIDIHPPDDTEHFPKGDDEV